MPDGKATPITFRISGDEALVRSRLGDPTVLQRSTDVEAGTVTVQLELPMSRELEYAILGLGIDVEVLAPENVREDLRQLIATLQNKYKKEAPAAKKSVQGDLFEGFF